MIVKPISREFSVARRLSTPWKYRRRRVLRQKSSILQKKCSKKRLKELFTLLFLIRTTKTVFSIALIVAKRAVSKYYIYICVSRFLIPFTVKNPVCIFAILKIQKTPARGMCSVSLMWTVKSSVINWLPATVFLVSPSTDLSLSSM